MQMSERFCKDESVLELYYSWKENEINLAKHELAKLNYNETSEMLETTPFIDDHESRLSY